MPIIESFEKHYTASSSYEKNTSYGSWNLKSRQVGDIIRAVIYLKVSDDLAMTAEAALELAEALTKAAKLAASKPEEG